jgi:hydrogenase expression/formation protein HypC
MCLGIPGRVEERWESGGVLMGTVDFGGVRKECCLAYVPGIQVGEWTIVHVGFALTRLDEKSARETLALMASAGMLDTELNAPGMGTL